MIHLAARVPTRTVLAIAIALVVAALSRAAMVGRRTVWMMSLIESTAGILSTTTSMSSSTVHRPMAHQDSIHWYEAGSVIRSVYRASTAMTRNGM